MMLARLARLWRRTTADPAPLFPAAEPLPTLDSDASAIGLSVAEWCGQRRLRTELYSSVGAGTIAALRERHADRVTATIAAADRMLRHEFDFLGSGPFVPRDPDRRPNDGYLPIDWYLDPVRGLRFPRGVHYKKWNLFEMRPGNADIKYPWELSRCQHWSVLGQAYRLTNDDRFALEIARQLDDFVEANPTGIGVNWTCTMDVGLRVVSWTIGLELVAASAALSDDFWRRACTALFDHAVFIRNNLENTYEVTSNHFLSNLLGLQFAGAMFSDLPHGKEWTAFARSSIEHEMDVQVLPDGADYESSIPYHRLVAELFLGALRLADHQGAPMSAAYRARAGTMIAFLAAVTRPDGLMPQVGDADDGRLHILEWSGTTSPQDARHLLGPAAAMFAEPTWLALGGGAADWEAAWWGLVPDAAASRSSTAAIACSRLFPDAGVAAARCCESTYLLVTNGVVGTNGFGNHKHNDLLSFEYHYRGSAIVVDPGSYVYTADSEARNRFRSTAYHNTLSIDGVEQNDLRPDWLFRMFETSNAESLSFDDRPDAVEYVGRHHGYERLPQPVTHERTLRLLKPSGALTIVDRLSGAGRHELRWHFHLAPGVRAERISETAIAVMARTLRLELRMPPGLTATIRPEFYSPSYGVKVECLAIDAIGQVDLAVEDRWEFSITP